MNSDFLQRFDREFALDGKLGEDYVEGLVIQGYSYAQIVRQAEALRNGIPLDELPLDMEPEDYYDYLSGNRDSLEDDSEIEPELVEYVYLDPNAPDDF